MISPDKPTPFEGLSKAGQVWAQESALGDLKDDIKKDLMGLYLAGTLVWHAHRRHLLTKIKKNGGVKNIKSTSFSGGLNFVELENGQSIFAADFLKTPKLLLDSRVTATQPAGTTFIQSHELRVAFGGSLVGGSMQRSDYDINKQTLGAVNLDQIINDEGFFPEEIGITESIRTAMGTDEKEHYTNHVNLAHYSIATAIWGSSSGAHNSPMPDPYTDYAAYRQWALRGNPQMDIQFQAPVFQKDYEQPTKATVIDKYGAFHPNGEVATTSLERFRSLLAYYATKQYPDLFPAEQKEKFGYLAEPMLELE
jgi:hypothetical protein